MKKILLTLFFAFLSATAFGAASDWYCTFAGAGGHDGSDEANAFDLAEAESEINTPVVGWADGDTMNVKGDAAHQTAALVISNAGGVGNASKLRGYTTTITDGGKATIERSGGAAELVRISGQWWEVENFILDGKSGGTYNIYPSNNFVGRNIESKNAGSHGFFTQSWWNCYAHNNGSRGFSSTGYRYYCITENNGLHGSESGRDYFSIGKGNTGDNFYRTYAFYHSISDGGSGDGVEVLYYMYAINSIIINAPVGKEGIRFIYPNADQDVIKNIDFYGNDSDTNVAAFIADGKQTVDPQFNDTANLDYTRTGTNLDDLGWSEVGMVAVDYNIDIGIDQKAVAGAAATFAGIVQLEAVGGRLRATWSAATGTVTSYNLYIRNGSSTNLFTSTYLLSKVDSGVTEYIFTTEADAVTLLQSTSTYYVGVRSENNGTEDANTVSRSASADGDGAVPLTINDRKLGVTGF